MNVLGTTRPIKLSESQDFYNRDLRFDRRSTWKSWRLGYLAVTRSACRFPHQNSAATALELHVLTHLAGSLVLRVSGSQGPFSIISSTSSIRDGVEVPSNEVSFFIITWFDQSMAFSTQYGVRVTEP